MSFFIKKNVTKCMGHHYAIWSSDKYFTGPNKIFHFRHCVPLFIRYALLSDRCILHKITSTNVIISHINNQTFYCSRVYTVCSFMFVVFYPQSLVVMLQYHISTTKYSTVPMFIQYVLLCSLYCTHNHLY